MQSGADHMTALIKDILNYGQLQNGTFRLEAEEFSLVGDVIAPAWRMLHLGPEGRAKPGVEAECTVAPDLPAAVVGDKTRLIQARPRTDSQQRPAGTTPSSSVFGPSTLCRPGKRCCCDVATTSCGH